MKKQEQATSGEVGNKRKKKAPTSYAREGPDMLPYKTVYLDTILKRNKKEKRRKRKRQKNRVVYQTDFYCS